METTLQKALTALNSNILAMRAQQEAAITVITSVMGNHDPKIVLEIQNSINELAANNLRRILKEQGF